MVTLLNVVLESVVERLYLHFIRQLLDSGKMFMVPWPGCVCPGFTCIQLGVDALHSFGSSWISLTNYHRIAYLHPYQLLHLYFSTQAMPVYVCEYQRSSLLNSFCRTSKKTAGSDLNETLACWRRKILIAEWDSLGYQLELVVSGISKEQVDPT